MNSDLGLSLTVVRASKLPSTPVDNDLVILNLASNNYVGLDDIGRRIWDLLEQPRRIDDICRQLASEYAGTVEEISADVLSFLMELRTEGLIRVSEG